MYRKRKNEYIEESLIKFNRISYDYRKLAILDGSGNIIEKGIDTIVGKKKGSETEFTVVDAQNNFRIIQKNELKKNKYNGCCMDYKVNSTSQQEMEI